MPIINFGGGPITWCHSVGQPVFSIRTTVARLLGPLLILAVCGCTASTMPPTTDDHRVLTQMPDLALTPPSRGPIGATVTLTVYEDYQ